MKKIIFMLFTLGLFVSIVACKTTTTTTTQSTTAATTKATTTAGTTATTSAATTEAPDTLKPVFKGLFNVTITVGDTFDPMAGVTAEDTVDGDLTGSITYTNDFDVNTPGTYTIYYTVSDAAGNTKTQGRSLVVKDVAVAGRLINPKFDDGLAPWSHWTEASSTADVVNGEAVIVIAGIGANNYSNQFEQKNLTLEEGKSYRIEFQARASEPRSIGVLVEDPNNGYKKYTTGEGVVNGQKIINLTTEMSTYFIELYVNSGTINTGKLGFMLGNVDANSKPSTVYLDNFVMTEVTPPADETAPTLNGVGEATVELNSTFDKLAGVSVTDDMDTTLTVADIEVTGDVDTTTAGEYTLTYTVTDASGNTATVTRKVKVVSLVFKNTDKIKNGDFAQELSVGWTTWVDSTDGWSGSKANATPSINNGVFEMNIAALGGQSWAVQLQQAGFTLEKGKTYKLIFDASSTVARDIYAKFGYDGANNQWVGYGDKLVSITDTLSTYEYVFTVTKDTRENLKLTFEMGGFNNAALSTVSIDNVKLQELDEPVLINNGNFSNLGFEPWFGNADWAGFANATYTIVDGVMVVDIASVGNQTWAVQLNQLGLSLEKDKTYKVVFDVKSDVSRLFEVKAKVNANDYVAKEITTTTDFVTQEFEFTFNGDNVTDGRFNFEMGSYAGATAGKVYFDNVKLLVKENDTFVETNQVKNGTFDQAVSWESWWGDQWSGVSTGSATVVDGVLVVDITAHGNAVYAVQATQSGLTLKTGRTYVIEFDIKADAARPINVQLGEPLTSDPWFDHFKAGDKVDVTTEWQHIVLTFEMTEPTNVNGKLVFELGNFASNNGTPDDTSDDIPATATGKVYIDNVTLYPKF